MTSSLAPAGRCCNYSGSKKKSVAKLIGVLLHIAVGSFFVCRLKRSPRIAVSMEGTHVGGNNGGKNMIGLVLISNWVGFILQIWQP